MSFYCFKVQPASRKAGINAVSIESPILFWTALGLAAATALVMLIRRSHHRKSSLILFFIGLFLLASAAGGLTLDMTGSPKVVVLVDQSASTRTAGFRDADAIKKRVAQLLGDASSRMVDFSSDSAEQTIFEPPADADVILLFSDGRFKAPTVSPPIYAVVDPKLEEPQDASITRIFPSGDDRLTVATQNRSKDRKLTVEGSAGVASDVPAGAQSTSVEVGTSTSRVITATISPGDAWPENDSLTLPMPRPERAPRWWIGAGPEGLSDTWRVLAPADLPADTGSYLAPAIIAMNNIPADALNAVQQERLTQFVRELGGGLVLIGGDHAFAVGDYAGTTLEALSPLSSSPQNAQREWVILVDGSGSMATPTADGSTRWARATAAAAQLLSRLPPNDSVNIGSFARDLQLWAPAMEASQLSKTTFPPRDVLPQGPTNLDAMLKSIAPKLARGARVEIVVISDADATIQAPEDLAMTFRDASARVHVLATGAAAGGAASIQKLSALTGGSFAAQPDVALWAASLRKLFLATIKDRLGDFPITIEFENELTAIAGRETKVWNRAWLKDNVRILATGDDSGSRAPLAARWRVGLGQVAAAAFPATATEGDALASTVAKAPRDPRFKVNVETGPTVSVTIEAADPQKPINDLNITMSIGDATAPSRNAELVKFTQTAPGKYQAAVAAPRFAALASIRAGDQTIDRLSIPARYAPEFNAIGNDREALKSLAINTSGAVIEPSQTTAIDFPSKPRRMNLLAPLAGTGALLIAIGLILSKRH